MAANLGVPFIVTAARTCAASQPPSSLKCARHGQSRSFSQLLFKLRPQFRSQCENAEPPRSQSRSQTGTGRGGGAGGAQVSPAGRKKVAKKAPDLKQPRVGWGGYPTGKGVWNLWEPWAKPALALRNPLAHYQGKKFIDSTTKKSPKGHPSGLMWSCCPVRCLFSPATDPFETPKHCIPICIGHQQGAACESPKARINSPTPNPYHSNPPFPEV